MLLGIRHLEVQLDGIHLLGSHQEARDDAAAFEDVELALGSGKCRHLVDARHNGSAAGNIVLDRVQIVSVAPQERGIRLGGTQNRLNEGRANNRQGRDLLLELRGDGRLPNAGGAADGDYEGFQPWSVPPALVESFHPRVIQRQAHSSATNRAALIGSMPYRGASRM